MNLGVKKIFPLFLSLFFLAILFSFRTVPVSQFWKGYRMLYVYTEALSESDILTILEKNGCDNIVSYGLQHVPLLSPLSPVQFQNSDSYISRRNDFFMDKTHRAAVFYIPEEFYSSLEHSIRELSAFQGTSAGTDGKSSFPWIAPLITSAFFLVLLYFSKKKALFCAGSVFFIILPFSRPLYTISAASCLFLFAFFLFHRLWLRKDFLKVTLNSPYILVFSLIPVLILLFSSPLNSLFYCISLAGTVLSVLSYKNYCDYIEEKNTTEFSFRPVMISSARMMPVFGRLGIRLLSFLLAAVILIFIVFNIAGNVSSFSDNDAMPSLPSPVTSSNSELVNLKDFVYWSWNTVTFPYKKIGEAVNFNEIPKEGESVAITDYVEDGSKIVPVTSTAYVFNTEFRESAYKSIEALEYPALEKMLLKQGKNASFGYAKSARSSSTEKFGSVLLLVFIAFPLALGIYYILGRKRYGLSI
ncbi:MAG: hypothetical protein II821_00765 [Treponema sp.]|nr:hypothetical protein [Treponema sp.]